jgi:hydroxymethylpyrimidine pyrophosphatase-like HAD family hydrolase
MIRENLTDKVLYYKPVPHALALEIAEEAERLGAYTQAYDYDELIVSALYDGEADRTGLEKPVGSLYGTALQTTRSFGRQYAERLGIETKIIPGKISAYIRDKKIGCTKLLVVCRPEEMPGRLRHFSDKFPAVICNTSEPYMMEIIDRGAGKDVACDVIGAQLGLKTENCMAIGDSMNDLTMVAHAGLGVAMANGRDALKAVAGYITDTNDNDGVAKAIEKFAGI